MKTIIAGCRDFKDYSLLKSKVNQHRNYHKITEIVCGGAAGADTLGYEYAAEYLIPTTLFEADWNTFGRAAGPIRNRQMAEYADCLIAVWDGKSKGTKNMIGEMNKLKKPVYIIWIGEPFNAWFNDNA
jgi:hypothetical protein